MTQENFRLVDQAFSKQSSTFDEDDRNNLVLQRMRAQVYSHVEKFIKPSSLILELNAGTGIDALHFISKGHAVHAVDIAGGMVNKIQDKISSLQLSKKLTVEKLSYDELDKLSVHSFDYVFSNMGGLNCIDDLSRVTRHLPNLLNGGAYITFVIMPNVCPWEIASFFRHGKKAFRRFTTTGIRAKIDNEFFLTYYHSLAKIKKAFDHRFKLVGVEGLAALTAQPHHPQFPKDYPLLDSLLYKVDQTVKNIFPFNRWADHIIVTFQYQPNGVGRKVKIR